MVEIGGLPDNGVTAIRNEISVPQNERFVACLQLYSPNVVNLLLFNFQET
jgi:hypothetical protein